MKNILYTLIAFFGIALWSTSVQGQCPNDNFFYVDVTPAFAGQTETETCMFGGEYATVNVIAGETYVFQTCNAAVFDTQITLYNNAGGASIAYDDDGCGLLSTITWVATFTGIVRVVVDEFPCQSGFSCIQLDVTWLGGGGPCNDVCLDAIPIATDGTPYCGNNLCGTLAGDYTLSCGFGGDNTDAAVWFSFVAPASGSVIVSTDFPGTDFDTQINLLGDLPGSPTNCPAIMYEYGCDEDGGTNYFGLTSVMSVSGLTPGQTYWIQLDGFMGETGQYCINVTEDPCAAYVGTFTLNTSGNATAVGNTIFVCNDVTSCFDIVSNNDYILPPAANFGSPGPPCVTAPELMYALYASPPITGDPEVDINFSGLFWTGEDFSDCNPSAFTPTIGTPGSTWYFVPITVDDGDDDAGCGGLQVDANNDGCYDYGAPFAVHYLNQIQAALSINTCGAFATITITGGSPQITGGNYALIHSGAGTLSSTSIGHNGSVTVSGLTNGSSFTITVTDPFGCDRVFNYGPITVDNVSPTITCPGNQTLNVNASCQATLPNYTALASANDNCPGVVISQSPIAGTLVGTGTTIVTLTATDAAGNTASCNISVVVSDNINPTITCPGNQTLNVNASCQATLPNYTALASANDNCPGVIVSQSPTAGTAVGVGTTVITLTATDAAGNTASCNFNVVVSDNINPTITCPGNQTLNVNTSCQATIPDYTGLATANDNCPGVTVLQSPAAGTIVGTGTTVITLTATDAAGNTASCNFNVVVSDNINPTITCPGNQTLNVNASCQTTIPDYTGLATANDNCPGVTVSQSPAAGTIVGTGTTVITLTATDAAGNTASCNFNVVVSDNINPTITCPGNQTLNVNASCQTTIPDYTGLATANDNCPGVTVSQSPAAGTIVGTGTTVITLTATDAAGNIASCNFNVVVSDNTPPSALCQGITIDLDITGNASITAAAINNGSSDNCGIASLNLNQTVFDCSNLGANSVILTVIDLSGNNATCNATVTVNNPFTPSVNAGSNSTICSNQTVPVSATLGGSATSGIWSTSGDGSFANANLINTTYTPGPNDISTGLVNLIFTTNLAPCTTANDQIQITINPVPLFTLTSSNDPSACGASDGSIVIGGLQPSTSYQISYQDGGAPIDLGNQSTSVAGQFTISNLDAGSYSNISVTINGCTYTLPGSIVLTDPASPTFTILASSNPTACGANDGSITLQGFDPSSNYSISYFNGSTTINLGSVTTDPLGNYQITGLPAGTYSNFVAVLAGCSGSLISSVTLTDPATPVAPLAGTNATYCQGNTIANLTATAGSGGTLTWYDNVALTNVVGTGATHTPSSSVGTHTYYVTETLLNCESSGTVVTIVVNPTPGAPVAGTNTTYCQGDAIVDLTATAGSAGTLTWYDDALLTNAVGTGATFTPSSAVGTHTYYVTETLGSCESGAAAVTIIVNPTPSFSIGLTQDPTACGGTDGSITLTGLNASTSYEVTYTDNSGLVNLGTMTTNASGEYVITGLGADTYSNITVTLGSCSSSQGPSILSDPNAPTFTLSSTNPTTCGGTDGTITIEGLDATTTYDISYNNGSGIVNLPGLTTDGTGSYALTGLTQGTYTNITATLAGCLGTNAGPVVLTDPSAPAAPTAGTNATYCQGDAVANLTATAGSGGNLTWYDDAALTNVVGAGATFTPSSGVGAPTYYVTETAANCESSASVVTIVVNPTPVAPVAGPDGLYCEGETVLDISATSGSGGTINWYSDAALTNQVGTGNTFSPDITVGEHTYYATESLGNCESDATEVIVVVNPTPTFTIVQETNPSTCGSSDGSFTITGLDPTSTYQVTYNSGATTIDLGNLTPNASGSITVGNLGAGTYANITVTLGLCSFQGGSVILVSPGTPDAPQVSGAATYCEGQAIAPLTASVSSGGTITWYADAALNNVINTGTTLNPDATPGTHTYYVTETVDGCESGATMVTVQINPTPAVPSVSGQGEYCNDAEVTLTAQSVSGTISWYTDVALTNLVQTGGSLSVSQNPGSYSYYVIASIGNCFSNSVPVSVLINECDTLQLEIPTAFTPNFDGVNDNWEIPGLKEKYPNNRVLVYNRWGNLIFESEGYDTPWDGIYNGEPLPVGSYFFIIDFNDGVKEQERGTVTIVKKN